MFNSLSGTITQKFPQKVFIDTHGIEWDVTVPDTALDALPPVGSEGKVYVWMQHTDSLMNLYGFATVSDRELFFDLLKVEGIGPKAAIKIMGNISASSLANILDSGDVEALQKVPGVGKKTAAKMLLQLKGKLSLNTDTPVSRSTEASPYADVITALVNMGYDRKEASSAVSAIAQRLSSDAQFASASQQNKEDAVFRHALVEMSK
ncbi:MAG: Holliday junction branch migration protein RuvA [Treponema sp.]|nr:Holliday junction branch migration protein RuvA [Treponema sp.]